MCLWSWRDGSTTESTGCSCRRAGLNSQHLHGGSQPSDNSSPRENNILFWPGMYRHICRQNSHIHKIKFSIKENVCGIRYGARGLLPTQPHPQHWKCCKWREDSSLVRVLGKATTPLCLSPLSPQLQMRDSFSFFGL